MNNEREAFEKWFETESGYSEYLRSVCRKAWQARAAHPAPASAPDALENCRLFAARHRNAEWAQTILRFCKEGGATGSPLRAAAPDAKTTDEIMALADSYYGSAFLDESTIERNALCAAVEQIVYECSETRKEWRVQHDRAERAERALAEAQGEPVAWIEHHKGGDNLCWDDPGGKRTPLYRGREHG